MKKQVLEFCQRLRISEVRAAIPPKTTSAILSIGTQEVNVIGRLTNLRNGYRYYFICPKCSNPYENLFMADFGLWVCRVCLGVVYASTRKEAHLGKALP